MDQVTGTGATARAEPHGTPHRPRGAHPGDQPGPGIDHHRPGRRRTAKSWLGPAAQQLRLPGTRAYLSAGLPGADWWVAGALAARAEDADVELDEVGRFYDERDLWSDLI
jgi:hypothetical protein